MLSIYRMPYKLIHKSNGRYKVVNSATGDITAKNTTKTKGMKQIKLLEWIEKKK